MESHKKKKGQIPQKPFKSTIQIKEIPETTMHCIRLFQQEETLGTKIKKQ
jgi:hypothetical protein